MFDMDEWKTITMTELLVIFFFRAHTILIQRTIQDYVEVYTKGLFVIYVVHIYILKHLLVILFQTINLLLGGRRYSVVPFSFYVRIRKQLRSLRSVTLKNGSIFSTYVSTSISIVDSVSTIVFMYSNV